MFVSGDAKGIYDRVTQVLEYYSEQGDPNAQLLSEFAKTASEEEFFTAIGYEQVPGNTWRRVRDSDINMNVTDTVNSMIQSGNFDWGQFYDPSKILPEDKPRGGRPTQGANYSTAEELGFARARGAKILAEMLAYGASADAYHITAPIESGAGAALAIGRALDKAGIKPDEVDYINAHGTSTMLNDRMETRAIKAVFGRRAYEIPVSSTKSMMGHLVGSAGAVEAVICIMAIRNGIMPPTINLTHPDPECDLDYVANTARPAKVATALSNSFGFGGHNSVLVFREYSER